MKTVVQRLIPKGKPNPRIEITTLINTDSTVIDRVIKLGLASKGE